MSETVKNILMLSLAVSVRLVYLSLIFGGATEATSPILKYGLLVVGSVMVMNFIARLIRAIGLIKEINRLDNQN